MSSFFDILMEITQSFLDRVAGLAVELARTAIQIVVRLNDHGQVTLPLALVVLVFICYQSFFRDSG